MTKNNNFVILGLIIIAFICRMIFETFGISWTFNLYYLSFLAIASTYYGLYSQRHNSTEAFDFIMDFKGGAQGGAMFAFGTGALTYVFYKLVHPHFLDIFIYNRRQLILDQQIQANTPAETSELAINNFNAFAEMIFVPFNWSMITVAALTFLSIVYALVFALITKFFPKFVNQ